MLARRVLLAFEPGHGLESVERAAEILASHLGWDEERRKDEIAEYQRWLDKLAVPDLAGPRSESFGAARTGSTGRPADVMALALTRSSSCRPSWSTRRAHPRRGPGERRPVYPRPGWVELDPVRLWRDQLDTAKRAMARSG